VWNRYGRFKYPLKNCWDKLTLKSATNLAFWYIRNSKKKVLRIKIIKNKLKIKKKNLIIKRIGIKIKKENYRVIVFGSGNYSLELMKKLNIDQNVIGYIDSNKIYHGLIRNGYKVYSIEQLKSLQFDKIIIASNKFKSEIYSILLKRKVKKNRIIIF